MNLERQLQPQQINQADVNVGVEGLYAQLYLQQNFVNNAQLVIAQNDQLQQVAVEVSTAAQERINNLEEALARYAQEKRVMEERIVQLENELAFQSQIERDKIDVLLRTNEVQREQIERFKKNCEILDQQFEEEENKLRPLADPSYYCANVCSPYTARAHSKQYQDRLDLVQKWRREGLDPQ